MNMIVPSPTSRASLLGLPLELRLRILELAYCTVTVDVDSNAVAPTSNPGARQRWEFTAQLLPLPFQPALINRQMHAESHKVQWHSLVTYRFPTSISCLDVLLKWPPVRLATLRHLYIVAYPLELFDAGPGSDHSPLDLIYVLPLLKGLQLETLTVEDTWFDKYGIDKYGNQAYAFEYLLADALKTEGWRQFDYVTGPVSLTIGILQKVQASLRLLARLEGEGGTRIFWRKHAQSLEDAKMDDDFVELTAQSDRPIPRADLPNEHERRVTIRAIKRDGIAYQQTGKGLPDNFRGLVEPLERMSWAEIRESQEYLYGDGREDYRLRLIPDIADVT